MSVKVAVRVRPFNQRESELGSQLVIDMHGKTTKLIDHDNEGSTRDFTFDYSFWSHDEFDTQPDGLYVARTSKYADQNTVFQNVGVEILNNAWDGYHCCLFAYGQTGSGKSYSMIGYGANRGIVPISCEEIFTRIHKNDNPNKSYEVFFSMLEIYNEKIQDLLVSINKRPAGGLKIREHKSMGVFVDGLTKYPVDNYEAIEAKTDEGNTNRTIGATQMNATSSRAHTIITIEFRQKEIIDKKPTERLSIINLVDLAGSEKLSKTGATGDRLKEGCSINQSLTNLGIVISSLALLSEGKKKVVIPYRNSALTRILQNALGGNSKTLMICALSPAKDNYDETLSTLRYADQAKKIKNHAVVNESEQDKMIRELREENEKLKALLAQLGHGMSPEHAELIEQFQANSALMKEHEKTFQQRLEEAKGEEEEKGGIDKTKPHIYNLNEDPLLTAKVHYPLTADKVVVGKKNADPLPDIVIGGIGTKTFHARFTHDDANIYLEAMDKEAAEKTFVNGSKVLEKRLLHDNDRIVFGTNTVFLFRHPEKPEPSLPGEVELDWEFAQKEISKYDRSLSMLKSPTHLSQGNSQTKEVENKLKEVEEKLAQDKADAEKQMKEQREDYERKIRELEQKMAIESEAQKYEIEMRKAEQEERELLSQHARREAEMFQKALEIERQRKEIQEEDALRQFRNKERHFLEHLLAKYIPQVTEMNLIAKELQRKVLLGIKLCYHFTTLENYNINFDEENTNIVRVQVTNYEERVVYYWDLDKFSNRYYIIKDIFDKFVESDVLPELTKVDDPFWDPLEPEFIGQGFAKLSALPYLIDNEAEIPLVGDKGICGTLNLLIYPSDREGVVNLSEGEEYVDDPRTLLGKELSFTISLRDARFEEVNHCNTYLEYDLLTEEGVRNFKTETCEGALQKPVYAYKKVHTFEKLADKELHYLLNHNLFIRVMGMHNPLEIPFDQHSPPIEEKREDEDEAVIESPLKTRPFTQSVLERKPELKPEENSRKLSNPIDTRLDNFETRPPAKSQQLPNPKGLGNAPANQSKKDKDCGITLTLEP